MYYWYFQTYFTAKAYIFQRSSSELTCINRETYTSEVLHKMFEAKRVIRHCHYSDNAELKLFITLGKVYFICFSSVSHFAAGENVLCNTSLDNYLLAI